MCYSGAEGTVERGVCAGAEQTPVRCGVAPGDSQVSAAVGDLRGLAAVEGGR